MTQSILAKYRPTRLREVLGQPEVIRGLQRFVQAPYSTPMLFHGESGVGKTSAAIALAHELGCAVREGPLGGLLEIASGEMSADAVRDHLRLLQYRPLMGSGWKVLVANECDRMLRPAETVWLDGLEHLPDRSVIIFTTNEPERLSQRFRDRCEVYPFASGPEALAPAIQSLARQVWQEEVGPTRPCPPLDTLGMPTLGDDDSMHASFRLALQQLVPLIRQAKARPPGEDLRDRCARTAEMLRAGVLFRE